MLAFVSQEVGGKKPVTLQPPEEYVLNVSSIALTPEAQGIGKGLKLLSTIPPTVVLVETEGEDGSTSATLCTLDHNTRQATVPVTFAWDEKITFSLAEGGGKGPVCISGYLQPSPEEMDDMGSDDEYEMDEEIESGDDEDDDEDDDDEEESSEEEVQAPVKSKRKKSFDLDEDAVKPSKKVKKEESSEEEEEDDEDEGSEQIRKQLAKFAAEEDDLDSIRNDINSLPANDDDDSIDEETMKKIIAKMTGEEAASDEDEEDSDDDDDEDEEADSDEDEEESEEEDSDDDDSNSPEDVFAKSIKAYLKANGGSVPLSSVGTSVKKPDGMKKIKLSVFIAGRPEFSRQGADIKLN